MEELTNHKGTKATEERRHKEEKAMKKKLDGIRPNGLALNSW
jgi:hypothetical protein